MNKYCLILFLGIFSGCVGPQQDVSKQSKDEAFDKLFQKYKPVTKDTFKIIYDSKLKNSKFIGEKLEIADMLLLPEGLRSEGGYEEFFGCYQFRIDGSRYGLITRTPSMYESSSMKCLVYDVISERVTSYFEIAENWGDAGAIFKKTSWLFKNKDNMPKFYTVEDYTYDHSVDPEFEGDSVVEREIKAYFLAFGANGIDTIKPMVNDSLLINKFW